MLKKVEVSPFETIDKRLTNYYIYQDHGMLSATASLGLIHMWDVDGGLVPIDK